MYKPKAADIIFIRRTKQFTSNENKTMSSDNSLPTVVGADLCNVLTIAAQQIGNTVADMDYQLFQIHRTASNLLNSADGLPPAVVSGLQGILQAAGTGRDAKKQIHK